MASSTSPSTIPARRTRWREGQSRARPRLRTVGQCRSAGATLAASGRTPGARSPRALYSRCQALRPNIVAERAGQSCPHHSGCKKTDEADSPCVPECPRRVQVGSRPFLARPPLSLVCFSRPVERAGHLPVLGGEGLAYRRHGLCLKHVAISDGTPPLGAPRRGVCLQLGLGPISAGPHCG